MPEKVYSLSGDKVAEILGAMRPAGVDPHAPAAPALPRLVSGRFVNSRGEMETEEFPVAVAAPSFAEYPDSDGHFSSVAVPPALSLRAQAPPAAAMLEIRVDGLLATQVPIATLSSGVSHLPPPSIHRIGNATASHIFPVFSERFTDETRFLDFVNQLHTWSLGQEPFNDAGIGSNLAFDAHYWPSDPVRGLFNTPDTNLIDKRLLYGDLVLARTLLEPWIGDKVSLILIDSNVRGGAGGQKGGYSAWTSVKAAPGEHWEAIGLHEVGHGLGLADEYVDDKRGASRPAELEPNISDNPLPSGAPWQAINTVEDVPAPTAPIVHHPPLGKEVVGTFQGARYRTDLYRPSETCLMKETGASFCRVCVKHIRETLGP